MTSLRDKCNSYQQTGMHGLTIHFSGTCKILQDKFALCQHPCSN